MLRYIIKITPQTRPMIKRLNGELEPHPDVDGNYFVVLAQVIDSRRNQIFTRDELGIYLGVDSYPKMNWDDDAPQVQIIE